MLIAIVWGAIKRRRAFEREVRQLIAMHGDDAGLIACHLATHSRLTAESRQHWGRLARAIGRRQGRSWRFGKPARAFSDASARRT